MTDAARMVKLAERCGSAQGRKAANRIFPASWAIASCSSQFDDGETRPGERVHVWRLMVQERDADRRPQQPRQDAVDGFQAPTSPGPVAGQPISGGALICSQEVHCGTAMHCLD